MTDDQTLVARLYDRVLYGDARLYWPQGHDPLSMEAADRISALEAERAWRPIESAPMGAELMVWCPSDAGLPHKIACFSQSLEWLDDEGRVLHPTHWLPLPQPPGGAT